MHKLILVTTIIACSFSAFGQNENQNPSDSANTYQPVMGTSDSSSDIVFTTIDQMPEFPGGQAALLQYLASNIRYPAKARKKDVEGKVIVKFVVCQDGSLCNEEVVRPIGAGCDEEVIRVIKAMPKWKPGKQNGQPVRVYYTLPVRFKLEDEKPIKAEK